MVSVVTTLCADKQGHVDPFLAGANQYLLLQRVQNGSGADPASYSVGTGISSPAGKVAKAKLTTHLYLVPRLGICGVIPPLHHMPS